MKLLACIAQFLAVACLQAAPMIIVRGPVVASAGGGGGAITEVGGGSQRATSTAKDTVDSGTLATPGNVASGSLMIVAGAVWGLSAAPSSVVVTDTRSTTYTTVLGTTPAATVWRTFIAYGVTTSAGSCTVTVNPAGADATHTFSFSLDEFTGQNASPADVNGGTTEGTSPLSDSILTVAANALIIGVMSQDGNNQTIAVDGASTQFGELENNTNNQCHNAAFRIATTATTYTMTWTWANVAQAGAQTHSFKP